MKKTLMIILSLLMFIGTVYAASWQIQEARSYYSNGQYNKALTSINSAIASSSNNDPEVYKLRLNIYLKLKDYTNALKDVNKLIELTNNYEYYYKRADIYLAMENYEAALKGYCDALCSVKNNAVGGKMLKRTGQALTNIARSTKASYPVRIQALEVLSGIYGKFDDFNNGIACLMKMCQLIFLIPDNDPLITPEKKKEMISRMDFSKMKMENGIHTELFVALGEYAKGNKEQGLKIGKGVLGELTSRKAIEAGKMTELFYYVIKVLDNGIPATFNAQSW